MSSSSAIRRAIHSALLATIAIVFLGATAGLASSVLCASAELPCAVGGPPVPTTDEPPTINPFGIRPAPPQDAQPGRIETSDGNTFSGLIYLTRDARLKIHDQRLRRQREIPLRAVARIDCKVKREWMEKEWRFKETTTDEKLTTGREYPAREYVHTIMLRDGRKIEGPLAALVYLRPTSAGSTIVGEDRTLAEPLRFALHKRDKGKPGTELKSLVYVRSIRLGKESEQAEPDKPRPVRPSSDSKGR